MLRGICQGRSLIFLMFPIKRDGTGGDSQAEMLEQNIEFYLWLSCAISIDALIVFKNDQDLALLVGMGHHRQTE